MVKKLPRDLCGVFFSTNQKGAKQKNINKIFFGSGFKRELCPLLTKRTKCVVPEGTKSLKVVNCTHPCSNLLCIHFSTNYIDELPQMIYRHYEFWRNAIFWLDKDWDLCKVLSIYLSKNNILSTNDGDNICQHMMFRHKIESL